MTNKGLAAGTTVAAINVKVSPDTKLFRVELQKELNEIERTMKGDVHIKAHLDGAQAKADFERLKSAMQKNGRIKVGVDMVPGKGGGNDGSGGGKGGKGGKGGGGNNNFGAGGIFKAGNLIPNFGSGINPAGYVAILGAAVLVAAPLIGLLSTAILAIPGLISAVATPFMAITLGLEGIKKAAAGSGLFSLDDEGKIDGLGAVFDPIKASVSQAFETGLTPAFKDLAAAIQPLLGSLPTVATGLTDMFKGFTDSLTSAEGIALFDQTIQNIGRAMSDAAPGIKDFTAGMMGLATSFTAQLPAFSGWLNRTGDSFVKWVQEMTTIPDPAGHHGPDPNGKSPMDQAFVGLGDTLRTIGEWAVNMAQAGLKFVSDPTKMDGFLVTLDKIGQAITKLVDLGNRLGPVWDLADKILPGGDQLPNVPGNQPKIETPKFEKPPAGINPEDPGWKPENAKDAGGFVGFLRDFATDLTALFSGNLFDADGTIKVGEKFVSKSAGNDKLQGVINTELPRINAELDKLQSLTADWLNDGTQPNRVEGYRARMAELKTQLAEIQTLQEQLSPEVGLKSLESPLSVAEGGTPTAVDQLLTALKEVPTAATAAKTAVDGVTGAGLTQALGELSPGANAQPAVPVPTPEPVPAPDVSAIPQAGEAAMGELAAAITTGGAAAQSAAQGVADSIKVTFDTAGASMIASGLNIATGLAAGITAGKSTVINAAIALAQAGIDAANKTLGVNSPSKVFIGIGESVGEGMGVGLENGFQPVLDQAKDLSGKISDAFNSGGDPTSLLNGFTDEESSRMEKVLNFESHKMTRRAKSLDKQFKATGDQRFKDEADILRGQIDTIAEQKDSLSLASEFADLKNPKRSGDSNPFVASIKELMKMPSAFATATAGQAMQDLNMSGDGALQAVAGWGMDFAQKGVTNIFNTSNVPDTIALSDNQTARESQGLVGRGN